MVFLNLFNISEVVFKFLISFIIKNKFNPNIHKNIKSKWKKNWLKDKLQFLRTKFNVSSWTNQQNVMHLYDCNLFIKDVSKFKSKWLEIAKLDSMYEILGPQCSMFSSMS